MIEFASNAAIFILIELLIFMINYEFKSLMSFNSSTKSNQTLTKKRISTRKSLNIIVKIRNI